MVMDPFRKDPHRGLKGDGTPCSTCHAIVPCHECCKQVWPHLCVAVDLPYESIVFQSVDSAFHTIAWDCERSLYDLSLLCDGYPVDLFLIYRRIGEICYAVLESETLQLQDSVKIEFSLGHGCECPVWDFEIPYLGTVTVRPYELVSLGVQKCYSRGPDDCTAGRCLPKKICAKVYTVSHPEGAWTTLTWYEDEHVEVTDCCCQATTFPEHLFGRVVNLTQGCECSAPTRIITETYGRQHGNDIMDAGTIIPMRYRLAETGQPWVDDYPNIPAGSHVWQSWLTSSPWNTLNTAVPFCPGPSHRVESPAPKTISIRMLMWCDAESKKWTSIVEIVDTSIEGDYASTPFSPYNTHANRHFPDSDILTCNPFLIRFPGIVEPNFCYDNDGNSGVGELEIHISEMIGWRGRHPFFEKDLFLYSEVVKVAAPPQTIAADCVPKLHIPDGIEEISFRYRTDYFEPLSIWPEPVRQGATFLTFEPYDDTSKVEISPRPCEGCEGALEYDDPTAPIQTACCSERVPRTLYVSAVNENDCPCAESVEFQLVYNPATTAWEGEAPFCGGCRVKMFLSCATLLGSFVWQLRWSVYQTGTSQPPLEVWTPGTNATQFSCEPFYWKTTSFSNNTCCDSAYAASQVSWEITA